MNAIKKIVMGFAVACATVAAQRAEATVPVPSDAIRLNCVRSNGSGYVKTGYLPNSKTRVVMEFQMLKLPDSSSAAYLGVQQTDGFQFFMGVRGKSGNFAMCCADSGSTAAVEGPSADFGRHTYDVSSGSQKFDGIEYGTQTCEHTATSELYLFAMNNRWQSSAYYNQSMVLYRFEIYERGDDGESLVRNFVPCLQGGEIRFWDEVGGQWCDYSGTGFDTLDLNLSVESSVSGLEEKLSPAAASYSLAVGQKIRITAPNKVVHPTTGIRYLCSGWRLVRQDGTAVTNAASCLFSYKNDGFEKVLKLIWHWARPVTDIAADIPAEYQLIEFVGSDGRQFVDTEIVPSDQTRVVVDFALSALPTAQSASGWGSTGGIDTFFWGVKSGTFMSSVSKNWQTCVTDASADTQRHLFDLQSGSQKFDGKEYGQDVFVRGTATQSAGENARRLYLFATSAGWTPTPQYAMSVNVYSCQIITNGVCARDLRPVRKIDAAKGAADEYGLYDLASGRYFTAKSVSATTTDIAFSSAGVDLQDHVLPSAQNGFSFILR